MTSREQGQVTRQLGSEWPVQAHSEAPLSRQFQQNKGANVHQSNLGRVLPRSVHQVTQRNDQLADIAPSQNEIQKERILL
mmetsp:Transcript_2758/g.5962  ORF Transcript_2758/g.5962 Transcript_2758/m.5962 type:complete len:80 (-) Transcript_2758:1570-1809(-)